MDGRNSVRMIGKEVIPVEIIHLCGYFFKCTHLCNLYNLYIVKSKLLSDRSMILTIICNLKQSVH